MIYDGESCVGGGIVDNFIKKVYYLAYYKLCSFILLTKNMENNSKKKTAIIIAIIIIVLIGGGFCFLTRREAQMTIGNRTGSIKRRDGRKV